MSDVVLRGKTLPAVNIYDLDPQIIVRYEEEVTLTLDQYVSSPVAQRYVETNLLQMLSGPSILPRTVLDTDVDPQTFNLRQRVVEWDHLSAYLQGLLSNQALSYYWLTDPYFTENPATDVISFSSAELLYGGTTYTLAVGSIGPATQDSVIIGTVGPLNLLTLRFENIGYQAVAPNEIVVGAYDFTTKKGVYPHGVSTEARDVSYDPSVSLIPATDVQGAIDYLAGTSASLLGTNEASWSINLDRSAEPTLAIYLKRTALSGDPQLIWVEAANRLYLENPIVNSHLSVNTTGASSTIDIVSGGSVDLRGLTGTATVYGLTSASIASAVGSLSLANGGIELVSSGLMAPIKIEALDSNAQVRGYDFVQLHSLNGPIYLDASTLLSGTFGAAGMSMSGSGPVLYNHSGLYTHSSGTGFLLQSPLFNLTADVVGITTLNSGSNDFLIQAATSGKSVTIQPDTNINLTPTSVGGRIYVGRPILPNAASIDIGATLTPFGTVYADALVIPGGVFKADGSVTATGDFNLGTKKITNMGNPVLSGDAVNLGYMQAYLSGYVYKSPVRLATTIPGTLATDFEVGDTLDTKTLALNDRILIKNQADPIENGIYTVNLTGAPTRASDADAAGELAGGMTVFVEDGDVNKDTGWVVTSDGPLTPGVDPILWGQIFGPGSVIAGDGLGQSGNTLWVNVAANGGLKIVADALEIKLNGTTLQLDGGGLGLSVNQSSLSLNSIGGTLQASKGGTGLDSSAWNGFVKVTAGVWSATSISTTDVSEGTNLYYTDERVDDRVDQLVVDGTGIQTIYDDLLGTLTFSVVADTTIQRVRSSRNGVFIAARQEINFIEGSNVTLSISDDVPNNRVNVTIASTDTGEANTASNVNVGGVGVYSSKVGVDLRFRGVNAGSNKISVTLDAPNNEIDVDVSEGNLTLNNIGGTLGVVKGGTGLATLAQGDILYASATDTLSALSKNSTATRYLSNTGTSNNPAWAQINLSNGVTGTLPAGNGGTGIASYTIGDIIYASGATALTALAGVATGNALISGGVGAAPSWGKIGLTTHVTGLLPFANIADGSALSVLGRSANSAGVMASIVAGTDNQVLRRSGTTVGFGAVNLASSDAVTGILPVANGGTGASTAFTTGSVVFAGASGVYAQDNTNFFWDNTNKRLVINNASVANPGSVNVQAIGDTYGFTVQAPSVVNQSAFFLYDIPLSSSDANGKAFQIRATGETSSRATFHSNGTYGIGSGSAARDIWVSREASGILRVSGNYAGTTAGTLHATGNLIADSQLRLNDADNSNYVAIASPSIVASNWTMTLPTTGGTADYVLRTDGTGVATWAQVSLTAGVTGLLPFANIAKGSALSVFGRSANSAGVMASIAAGTDNQVLRRSGTTLAFGAIDLASSSAVSGLLPLANMADLAGLSVLGRSASASGVMAAISAGTDGQVLRRSGTALGFGAVSLSTAAAITGTLPVGNGGTGQTTALAAFDALAPTTTQGDLLLRGASSTARLAIGASGTVLTSNGTTATWAASGSSVIYNVYGSLCAQANSTTGYLSKHCPDGNNPSGKPTTTGSTNFQDGGIDGYVIPVASTITRVDVTVGAIAVSQATVGTNPTMRIAFYSHTGTTRTLLGNADVVMDQANCGINNNLGGSNFQTRSLTGLSISVAAGTLLGFEFENRSTNNTMINGASRISVAARIQES